VFPVFLTGPTAGNNCVRPVADSGCGSSLTHVVTAIAISAAPAARTAAIPARDASQGSTGTSIARHPA
jgi:hypothetical protein